MQTSVAVPRPHLGAPPRAIPLLTAVHVLLGDFMCWFGAVFSFPLLFAPLAMHDSGGPAVFILVFPACGVTMFVLGARKGLRGLRLLRTGLEATGTFIDEAATGAAVNDVPVMRMRFRFVDGEGHERVAIAKTHETAALKNEEAEPLLYDPSAGGDAMLLDDLPGLPRIRAGRIVVHDRSTVARAWLALVAASVVVFATGSTLLATVAALGR